MPLSEEQIINFTTKAKQAGATDQQIMASIAKKRQQVAEIDRVNQGVQAGVLSPEKAFEMGADVGLLADKKVATNKEDKAPLISAISDLLKGDTGAITGSVQIGDGIGNIPANIIDSLTGRKAQTAKNTYDQLQGMLSLDNISKLKGTGAISDAEFKTLSQAASRLGRNLSNDDFRKVLEGLQTEMGGTTGIDQDDDALINKYKGK